MAQRNHIVSIHSALQVVNDNEGTDGTNGETQLLPFVQHFYGDMQDMTDGTGTDEMGTDGGDR